MTLALVFAMTGGAYAAKKYLITNTKQISPSVLKQLKGAKGPAGAAGANGTNGAPGAQGAKGENGAPGRTGTNGTNGKSVLASTAAGTECVGRRRRHQVRSGRQRSPRTRLQRQKRHERHDGFTEELPSKKTEIGSWSANSAPQLYRCVEATGKGNFTDNECLHEAGTPGAGNFEREPIRHAAGGVVMAPISFNIPLKKGAEPGYALGEHQVHYIEME